MVTFLISKFSFSFNKISGGILLCSLKSGLLNSLAFMQRIFLSKVMASIKISLEFFNYGFTIIYVSSSVMDGTGENLFPVFF